MDLFLSCIFTIDLIKQIGFTIVLVLGHITTNWYCVNNTQLLTLGPPDLSTVGHQFCWSLRGSGAPHRLSRPARLQLTAVGSKQRDGTEERGAMDLKMNSLGLDLLGMRFTMKMPQLKKISHANEDEATEYKISIVRQGPEQEQDKAVIPNNGKPSILRKDSLLKYDHRVVNQLLTVEQLQNIENWLGQQPDKFATEEVEQQELAGPFQGEEEKEGDAVDIMDGFLEEVTKATNHYRDIANNRNKRQFLCKKIVTLV